MRRRCRHLHCLVVLHCRRSYVAFVAIVATVVATIAAVVATIAAVVAVIIDVVVIVVIIVRQKDKSGHGKNPSKRGALRSQHTKNPSKQRALTTVTWRAQMDGQVRT